MKRIAWIACAAAAGMASAAAGQGVTLTFDADITSGFSIGDTVSWTVSASFTGYDDPAAYFGGFVGSFDAYFPETGVITSVNSLMSGVAVSPSTSGASVLDINIFHSALLGTDDPSNPLEIFTFDVQMLDFAPGSLSVSGYSVSGVATVFPDSNIFTLGDEYGDIRIVTDGVVPTPSIAAVLGVGGIACARRRR